jgi:ribonuclease HI
MAACPSGRRHIHNNFAEYRGLEALLQAFLRAERPVHLGSGTGPLQVCGDSQLVIRQVNEEWACNAPHLIALRKSV